MKEKFVDKFLDIEKFEYDIFFTEESGHATELCKEALKNNYDIIAAVGGDGTLNEVGRALIGTDTQFAIIPAGSGNGFALHLGVPLTLKGALNVINKGKVQKIDTVTIKADPNGTDEKKSEIFISTAGVGFDAQMAYEFNAIANRGFWGYIKATARNVFTYKVKEYELNIGERLIKTKAFVVAFANSSQYGNNATISPHAVLDDGLVDVCIVRKFPMYKVFAMVYRVFSKTLHKSRYMEIIRAPKVILKGESDILHIDGDSVKLSKEFEVKVNPLSLNVIVP